MAHAPDKPKAKGYRVRITGDHVAVEHREPFGWNTVGWAVLAYLFLLSMYWLPSKYPDASRSDFGGYAIVALFLTFISLITWSRAASGELFYCDGKELRFAKRRNWGRWTRLRFSCKDIHELQYAWRGGPKQRTYTVLTFQCDGQTHDVLEDLSKSDVNSVLRACKSMGLSVVLPDTTGDVMLADIEKRGWWVNPLKPEHEEHSATKD